MRTTAFIEKTTCNRQCLLSTYYVPGTGLGARDTAVSTTGRVPVLTECCLRSLSPALHCQSSWMNATCPASTCRLLLYALFWPFLVTTKFCISQGSCVLLFHSQWAFLVITSLILSSILDCGPLPLPRVCFLHCFLPHFILFWALSCQFFPFPCATPLSVPEAFLWVLLSSHFSPFCTIFLYIPRTSTFLFFASPGQPPL